MRMGPVHSRLSNTIKCIERERLCAMSPSCLSWQAGRVVRFTLEDTHADVLPRLVIKGSAPHHELIRKDSNRPTVNLSGECTKAIWKGL